MEFGTFTSGLPGSCQFSETPKKRLIKKVNCVTNRTPFLRELSMSNNNAVFTYLLTIDLSRLFQAWANGERAGAVECE